MTRRDFLLAGTAAALVSALPWRPLFAAEKSGLSVVLYKNPGCGCCEDYGSYLRQHGFKVTIKESDKVAAMSANAGVPADLQGCHTAFIDGYVVDGHVPIEAIRKLLAEHPSIKGLTVPGMPPGSPGMAGIKEEPLVVYAIDTTGTTGTKSIYMTM